MKDAERVTFGGAGLDRATERRREAEALATSPEACVLPLWRGKPLVRSEGARRALAAVAPDADVLGHCTGARVFLGCSEGAYWFAADVSAWAPEGPEAETLGAFHDPSEQVYPGLGDGTSFAELRRVMTALSPRDAEIGATARAILEWHRTHRFCARCGAESAVAEAGWSRTCPACSGRHFPRTDPVVIMLITHGNSVLLGRSPAWPDGMYSLLAGYMEPGETIEAAVRRETWEEAGVRVGSVSYLASQPWPFPASLMIGCHGAALGRELRLDPAEIEDAMWLTREELLAVHSGENARVTPAREGAIARFLLDRWLADRLD
jgi:NAD+ diphosphatase